MSGELHATFAESSPGGTHALPLVAPPVAQPVAPPVAAPVALPVTRQRPGTVNTVAANDLRKPHRDRSRDHAQARTETTTSNTNFPAPASRKVTTNQHVLSILHVGSQPTKTPTFPHQKAKRSPQNQHVLSYNPHLADHLADHPHILEGAGPEADPFEYPINTVQVSRCAPFPGSPRWAIPLA